MKDSIKLGHELDILFNGMRSYNGLTAEKDEEIITAINEDGSISYIGLIRSVGWYLLSQKRDQSVREKLLGVVQNIRESAEAAVISATGKLISDGLSEAFTYDTAEMIRKVYLTKEITPEAYDQDPLRIAFMDRVSHVTSKSGDVGLALALLPALADTPPAFAIARKQTLALITEQLKTIEEATGCGVTVNTKIAAQMFEDAMYASYSIYHIEEMNDAEIGTQFLQQDIISIIESLSREPLSDEDRGKLQAEKEAAEERLRSLSVKFYTRAAVGADGKTYDQARDIYAERILKVLRKVYPEKKAQSNAEILTEIKRSRAKGTDFPTVRYAKLPQAKHINDLSHLVAKKITDPAQIDFIGRGTVESKDFRLFIERFAELPKGISPSASRLLDALTIKAGQTRDTKVTLPLKEYMAMRGMRDEKEARLQVKADILALERVSMEFRPKTRGKYGNWLNIRLSGGTCGIVNGAIVFRFNVDYLDHLPIDQFIYLPSEYFSFNLKYNPHSAYFLRKAALHKYMNHGKPNEDIIGVETLIASSPNFPRKEDIGAAMRVNQQIIEPFERDLDAITEFSWEYVGGNPKGYDQFIKAKVKLTWCQEYHELRTNDGSRKRIKKKH